MSDLYPDPDLNPTPDAFDPVPGDLPPADLPEQPFEPASDLPQAEPPLEHIDHPESSVQQDRTDLADLSLAQALGALLIRPAQTWRTLGGLWQANQTAQVESAQAAESEVLPPTESRFRTSSGRTAARSPARPIVRPVDRPAAPRTSVQRNTPLLLSGINSATFNNTTFNSAETAAEPIPIFRIDRQALLTASILIACVLLAVAGGVYMLRNGQGRVPSDTPFGLAMMLISTIVFSVTVARTVTFPKLPAFAKPDAENGERGNSLEQFFAQNGLRVALAGVSLIFMAGAWLFNGDNKFTATGVVCWLLSIFGWLIALAPNIFPTDAIPRALSGLFSLPGRIIAFRISPTLIAIGLILIAGGYFRFSNLDIYLPDMTSDHVEKALDAQRISEGATPVFLPNNGGREVLHFYLLAAMHSYLGLPIDFDLLKLLTAIEGMLGIIAVWWLGRELIGDENPQLGNLTGVIMAGLLAVSYWDTMLSRLGLRIVLTPLVTAVLLVYFIRALRHNQRIDFVRAGLVLGIGVYCYQAMRMAPVFVVIGILLALILRARSWAVARRYVTNFAAMVIIAVVVFVPLGRFMIQYPDDFWSRASGRLFGDSTVEVKDPATGSVVSRVANTQDRLDALRQNLGYLGTNMQHALLMFNWSGDSAWITGTPDGVPQMDLLTGALFLIGLGVWLVRMIRRRDPADWLIPFGLLVMLLPTALSLAYTIEVPSATRASGEIPFAFALAAFPAALLLTKAWAALQGFAPRVLLSAVIVVALILIASANWSTYFDDAMPNYRLSTLPHRQAGQVLKGFEQSTGAPGNAFMIGYDYWWDHRALAIEADDIHWNNGVERKGYMERIIALIRQNAPTPYAFRPDRQMMFFLNQNDTEVLNGLMKWLPNGSFTRISSFKTDKDFTLLIIPPLGCDWLNTTVGTNLSTQCPRR